MNLKSDDPEKYLKDARRVAEQLIQMLGERGLDNCSISSHTLGEYRIDLSLDSGVAGIVLFFVELYEATKDKAYLAAAERLLITVDVNAEVGNNFSFMNGKSGFTFTYLKLYQATNQVKFLEKAVRIIADCDEFITSPFTNNSIYDGRAGLLLALLFCYRLKCSKEIAIKIALVLEWILKDLRYSDDGVYWYYNQYQISGLCGFGLGASGIAYALTILGREISNNQVLAIASEAFDYCYNNWDSKKGAWPHYCFTEGKPMSGAETLGFSVSFKDSICLKHGAIGILLAFILSDGVADVPVKAKGSMLATILNSKLSRDYPIRDACALRIILDKSRLPNVGMEYCHVSRTLDDLDRLVSTQKNALPCKLGLSNGLAGSGYYFLLAAEKINTPYFLGAVNFEIDNRFGNKPLVKLNKLIPPDVNLLILSRVFFRTFQILRLVKNKEFLQINKAQLPHSLWGALAAISKIVERDTNGIVKDAFKIEVAKFNMVACCRLPTLSVFYNRIESTKVNRALQLLNDDQFLSKRFRVNPHCRFISTEWDVSQAAFRSGFNLRSQTRGIYHHVLYYTYNNECVREMRLKRIEEFFNLREPVTGEALFRQISQNPLFKNEIGLKNELVQLLLSKVQENVILVDACPAEPIKKRRRADA